MERWRQSAKARPCAIARSAALPSSSNSEGDRQLQTPARFVGCSLPLHGGADRSLRGGVLEDDEGGGQRHAADCAPPKRVHVLHEMCCPVLRERDVAKASAVQQAVKLVGFREAQARMARRQRVWRPGTNLRHGVTDQALDALLVRGVPPREGDATAHLERAQALCEGSFWIGKVSEP